MKTSLTMFARRAGLAVTKRSYPLTAIGTQQQNFLITRKAMSSQPSSDSATSSSTPEYDGHLAPEQMAVLDTFFDRVSKLEADVAQIRESISNVKPTFGVDAPDGDVDASVQELKKAFAESIINDAAKYEDTAKIMEKHKLQQQGVDAPDGDPDGQHQELKGLVNSMIDQAAKHEDTAKIMEKHMLQQRGVDAPDGDSDGHVQELKRVMHAIIDEASKNEDTAKIMEKHKLQQYGVDAPDGDSDGYIEELKNVINKIIDDAAAHEDTAKINSKHKLQKDVKEYHARDPEHDW